MWDVEEPVESSKGGSWNGFDEEKLKVFEVINPRPGEFAHYPTGRRRREVRTPKRTRSGKTDFAFVFLVHRNLVGWNWSDRSVPSTEIQEVPQLLRYSSRCVGLGTF